MKKSGNLSLRRNPVVSCPISGFHVHIDDMVWNGREYVSPEEYDEPSYRETGRRAPRPHPLSRRKKKPIPRY